MIFSPSERQGSGPPLLLLHGFLDTWRTWELVIPRLAETFDVLALTLPGHAGGPAIGRPVSIEAIVDQVAKAIADAGFERPHVVGNSLGGFIALRLATQDLARSVVAIAPAGGWPRDERPAVFSHQAEQLRAIRFVAPRAHELAGTEAGRKRITAAITKRHEHIPDELVAHLPLGAACCAAADELLDYARSSTWNLEVDAIACPVRFIWGTEDALLPWPSASARFRNGSLGVAEWVELEGVGHCPQLDVPLQTAELIRGHCA